MSLSLAMEKAKLTALSENELDLNGGGRIYNWIKKFSPLLAVAWVQENWSDLKGGMAAGWNADDWK